MTSFSEIIKNEEYLERVIKHFRIPVRTTVTKEKFDSYMEFLHGTNYEQYRFIVETTEEDFNRLCLEQETNEPDFSFESIVEQIVNDFSSSTNWQNFIEQDYSNTLEGYQGVTSTHGLYSKENDGKCFVSIDLVSANWQSLQKAVGFEESYENLVSKYTDYKIPVMSKTFRTKISGLIGAKKIMEFNKYLLRSNQNNILNTLSTVVGMELNREPFAFYADEFLIELTQEELKKLQSLNLEEAKGAIYNATGVKVHIRPFRLKWLGVEKSCIKEHKDNYEIINISKDILLLMNKVIHPFKVNKVDFEKVKLGDKTEEEYLQFLRSQLISVGVI